jgi:hypothetical protein
MVRFKSDTLETTASDDQIPLNNLVSLEQIIWNLVSNHKWKAKFDIWIDCYFHFGWKQ